MRFLANENFPLLSVRLLRQAELEVASITEDSPGIEDSEVLGAADEERVILTFDRALANSFIAGGCDRQEVSFICGFVLTRRKNHHHQYC
jgi:predicted nuclease of predicted toxin-antitoxin system